MELSVIGMEAIVKIPTLVIKYQKFPMILVAKFTIQIVKLISKSPPQPSVFKRFVVIILLKLHAKKLLIVIGMKLNVL